MIKETYAFRTSAEEVAYRMSLSDDEKKKYMQECVDIYKLAEMYGKSVQTISSLIKRYRIPSQLFNTKTHRNGRLVRVFHPSHLAPFIKNVVADISRSMYGWFQYDKIAFKCVLRAEAHTRKKLMALIKEIEEEEKRDE
jgi:hypothetical protein